MCKHTEPVFLLWPNTRWIRIETLLLSGFVLSYITLKCSLILGVNNSPELCLCYIAKLYNSVYCWCSLLADYWLFFFFFFRQTKDSHQVSDLCDKPLPLQFHGALWDSVKVSICLSVYTSHSKHSPLLSPFYCDAFVCIFWCADSQHLQLSAKVCTPPWFSTPGHWIK